MLTVTVYMFTGREHGNPCKSISEKPPKQGMMLVTGNKFRVDMGELKTRIP